MIDYEYEIYTQIAAALRFAFPGINVQGVTTYSPSAFPCACIEEADNSSHLASRDTASNENHADVMYEVNVYSNKVPGAKDECKSILNTIDTEFDKLGFTRTGRLPVNTAEVSQYRLCCRYSATVGKDGKIYRR